MKDRPDELPPSRLLGQEEATPTMEADNAQVAWKAHRHIINRKGNLTFSHYTLAVFPQKRGKMIYTDDMKLPIEDGD